jgi:hypothetical protein
MRSSSVPARPVQHEGTTITPPSTPAAKMPETPKVEEQKTDVNMTMPDPIDMNKPAEEPAKDTSAPLESPFLSDAKVEKRPLGAFSNEVHSSEPTMPASPDLSPEKPQMPMTTTEPKDTTETKSDESDTPMPAELQPGLLSIEANEDTIPAKSDVTVAAPAAEVPTGPTSITQQYTPQPSTGDKPVASVFDTAAYKQPQARTGKKKSGWLVIVWILLLLVVGAGIGAAVYFFVLPRL